MDYMYSLNTTDNLTTALLVEVEELGTALRLEVEDRLARCGCPNRSNAGVPWLHAHMESL